MTAVEVDRLELIHEEIQAIKVEISEIKQAINELAGRLASQRVGDHRG